MEREHLSASEVSPQASTSSKAQRKWFPIRKALRPFLYKPAPELVVNEAVVLRSLELEHTDRIFSMIQSNRTYLQNWISWIETIQTYQDCKNFVNGVRYKDIFAGQWVYGLWYQDQLWGLLDFNEGDRELNQISIGYWLDESVQGKGIVSQAVMRCLDYVFEELQLHKVLIKCAEQNKKSQAIPIRLGFTWEGFDHEAGTVNGKTVNMVTYSMMYRDWLACRKKYVEGSEA